MVSKEDIKNGLTELGVEPGMILEVHSSLSSFGHVDGNNIVMINDIVFKGKRSVEWSDVEKYLRQCV